MKPRASGRPPCHTALHFTANATVIFGATDLLDILVQGPDAFACMGPLVLPQLVAYLPYMDEPVDAANVTVRLYLPRSSTQVNKNIHHTLQNPGDSAIDATELHALSLNC